MAFTPLDPTKAEVRVVGEAPNQQLDIYIPRGAKGEPGGFVTGTPLGTANLDQIKTPGLYRQISGANATALNNYPRLGNGGVLIVQDMAADYLIQTYEPLTGLTTGPGVMYKRALNGTVWTPWRTLNTTRTSEAAGRAIYQWDELNYREQLIYGSTGLRDISTLTDATWYSYPGGVGAGYSAYVRRNGNTVHFSIRTTVIAANGSGTPMVVLPVGFRSDVTVTAACLLEAGAVPTPTAAQATPTGSVRVWHSGASGVLTINLVYTTADPWPTTLPGTAVGTIPNV